MNSITAMMMYPLMVRRYACSSRRVMRATFFTPPPSVRQLQEDVLQARGGPVDAQHAHSGAHQGFHQLGAQLTLALHPQRGGVAVELHHGHLGHSRHRLEGVDGLLGGPCTSSSTAPEPPSSLARSLSVPRAMISPCWMTR